MKGFYKGKKLYLTWTEIIHKQFSYKCIYTQIIFHDAVLFNVDIEVTQMHLHQKHKEQVNNHFTNTLLHHFHSCVSKPP